MDKFSITIKDYDKESDPIFEATTTKEVMEFISSWKDEKVKSGEFKVEQYNRLIENHDNGGNFITVDFGSWTTFLRIYKNGGNDKITLDDII